MAKTSVAQTNRREERRPDGKRTVDRQPHPAAAGESIWQRAADASAQVRALQAMSMHANGEKEKGPDKPAVPLASPKPAPARAPVQMGKFDKSKKLSLLQKLRGSYRRNKISKALPKQRRRIFDKQRRMNYGYKEATLHKLLQNKKVVNAIVKYDENLNTNINPSYTQINVGDVKGYYRRGWGNQPFLYLDSEGYDDKMIRSNYDDIIGQIDGDEEPAAALEILEAIETGEEVGTDKPGQAKSLFVLLTQFIESHESRIPGSDKLARALLRRIALGQLTFKQAFNRKNGLFVSAWAKKGGAKVGGQVAGRSLFGFSREKDKYTLESLEKDLGENNVDDLFETIDGYYSDESDVESEEDFDFESESSKQDLFGESALEKINEALQNLGMGERLKSVKEVLFLTQLEQSIKKAFKKSSLLHHPDTGGNSEDFQRITKSYDLLKKLIDEHRKEGYVDFSRNALAERLEQYGVRSVPIRGDGNCFYASVLDQIAYNIGGTISSDVLRGRIAQLIIDNADHFRVFVTGGQLDRIVSDILTSRSWRNMGGDFAPQLIATVLQQQVVIIQPSGPLQVDPIGGLNLTQHNTLIVGNSPITIVYDGSGHYESTRSTRGLLTN